MILPQHDVVCEEYAQQTQGFSVVEKVVKEVHGIDSDEQWDQNRRAIVRKDLGSFENSKFRI
jgi:hypothetical protein